MCEVIISGNNLRDDYLYWSFYKPIHIESPVRTGYTEYRTNLSYVQCVLQGS